MAPKTTSGPLPTMKTAFALAAKPERRSPRAEEEWQILLPRIQALLRRLRRLPGVTKGLCEQQRLCLAALLFDLLEVAEESEASRESRQRLRKMSAKAPAKLIKVAKRADKIRSELAVLKEDVQALDPWLRPGWMAAADSAITNMSILPSKVQAATRGGEVARYWETVNSNQPWPASAWQEAKSRAFDFLRACGVGKVDAQRRVGRVGNALFGSDVTIRLNDAGQMECAAVRMHDRRRHVKRTPLTNTNTPHE